MQMALILFACGVEGFKLGVLNPSDWKFLYVVQEVLLMRDHGIKGNG